MESSWKEFLARLLIGTEKDAILNGQYSTVDDRFQTSVAILGNAFQTVMHAYQQQPWYGVPDVLNETFDDSIIERMHNGEVDPDKPNQFSWAPDTETAMDIFADALSDPAFRLALHGLIQAFSQIKTLESALLEAADNN